MRIKGLLSTALACAGMTISVAAAAQTAPAATSAPAAQTAPAAATPAAKKSKPADKLICTREPIIGSKFTTKVCTTAQGQADRKLQDQQFLNKAQTPGYSNGN